MIMTGKLHGEVAASGATSLRAIAKALNARGIATARGGVWTPVEVTAVLRRVMSGST